MAPAIVCGAPSSLKQFSPKTQRRRAYDKGQDCVAPAIFCKAPSSLEEFYSDNTKRGVLTLGDRGSLFRPIHL